MNNQAILNNKICNILKNFGVNDATISNNLIIIPIEKDPNSSFTCYKLVIESNELEDKVFNVSIYSVFYHNMLLKDEQKKLLILLNKLNMESPLKFTMIKDVIKVSLELSDIYLNENDIEYIVRNITLFPSFISMFEQDLLKVIK